MDKSVTTIYLYDWPIKNKLEKKKKKQRFEIDLLMESSINPKKDKTCSDKEDSNSNLRKIIIAEHKHIKKVQTLNTHYSWTKKKKYKTLFQICF